jgi:hypothetical protein
MTLVADPYSWRYIVRVLLMLALLLAMTAILAQARKTAGPSGEGAGTASGYVVSEVEYNLLASDPGHIDGVTFNMTAAQGSGVPNRVTVSVDGGGQWTACEPADGLRWECPLHTSVRELTSLRVVAAQYEAAGP